MDNSTMQLVAGWIETAVVAAILLICGGFLVVLIVRFFRGQTKCSCDSTKSSCPAAKAASAMNKATAALNRDSRPPRSGSATV